MATWKQPKNDYKKEDQVVPEIFNTLAENERYLQETKITTEQVQDAEVSSTQATTRENLGDKETVKGFFGKVRKWFADLKALAFKKTVATADIDDSAVTTAKIASSAVTSAKIGTNAVTTAKINGSAVTTAKIADKAVTDAKINTVSASKVTGLHKVATSGSYNDLVDKPETGGGGLNFKRYDFYLGETVNLEPGIYLGFIVWTNRASLTNVANCGLITYSPDFENGSYSGISSFYDSGEELKVQITISQIGRVGIVTSSSEKECPYISGYDGDGGFRIVLMQLCDLGTIGEEMVGTGGTPSSGGNTGGGGTTDTRTWQKLSDDVFQVQSDFSSNSTSVYIPGLKKGDTVKFTAMSVKMNCNPNHECYFYNTPDGNMVYGFSYDGYSYDKLGNQTGWYQHQNEYDYPSTAELNFSSESPYVGNVGLRDYGSANQVTITVSCKSDNMLTIEWSDQAGFYIEMMPIYEIYVKR